MMASLREGFKKNCEKAVRLTALGLFSPLNMIPWYPKQILLHCEEPEKCIEKTEKCESACRDMIRQDSA